MMNPFPGLRPFEPHEHHLFFGRENQINQLTEKLRRTHFLAVVGTSGSGKSSLIRAGFIPFLTNNNNGSRTKWLITTMRPGNDPIGNLANALNLLISSENKNSIASQGEFTEIALRHGSLGLIETIKELRLKKKILIVVDQFEELFRFIDPDKIDSKVDTQKANPQNPKDDAQKFVKLLLEASWQRDLPIYIALTLRSDYLGDCPRFRDLPETITHSQYLIPRLTRNQLRQAVQGPIKYLHKKIASRLVSRILNEIVDTQDELPILQHALMRTYAAWTKDTTNVEEIDIIHYEIIGGMNKALSQHADEIYLDLSNLQKQNAATLFKSLTEFDADTRLVRRHCQLKEISAVAETNDEEIKEVVDAFRAPGRSFIMPPASEDISDKTILDISHESLIRQWRRLNKWVFDETESGKTYRRLEDQAVRWSQGQGELWGSIDLDIVLQWKEKNKPHAAWAKRYGEHFDLAMKFLDKSDKKDKLARKLKFVLVVALGVLIAAAILGGYAVTQKEIAESQRDRAQQAEKTATDQADIARKEKQKAIEAKKLADMEKQKAIEANKELKVALKQKQEEKRRADQAAIRAEEEREKALKEKQKAIEEKERADQNFLRAEEAKQKAIEEKERADDQRARADDATRIAEKAKKIAEAEQVKATNLQEAYRLTSLALQEVDHDPTVALRLIQRGWELEKESDIIKRNIYKIYQENEFYSTIFHHDAEVLSIAFVPDREAFVTGCNDGSTSLWNLNGNLIPTFKENDSAVNSVAISPDSQWILTGFQDKTARLWDLEGNLVQNFKGHEGAIWGIAFSPDGQSILTGSEDTTARLWDLEGNEIQKFAGHQGSIRTVAFAPDGQTILTGSEDKTARLWSLDGQEIRKFEGHKGTVRTVAFAPDGDSILTGSSDHTARLWELEGQVKGEFRGHSNSILAVAFDPTGKFILTASDDKTAKLWDIEGAELRTFKGHRGPIQTINFSPNGEYILTGSQDKTVRKWEWSLKGNLLLTMKGHKQGVQSVAFPIGGESILSGSLDKTVKLWDATGNLLRSFEGFKGPVRSVAFAPNSQFFLTASYHVPPQLLDFTGKVLQTFKGHLYSVRTLAFAPDGRSIVTGSDDKTAKLWNVDGHLLKTFKGHQEAVLSVAYDPEGEFIVTGSDDHTAKLWFIDGNKKERTFKGHVGAIWSVAVSPRIHCSPDLSKLCQFILTGSDDNTARLWNLDGKSTIKLVHDAPVRAVAFSPTGQSVLTGSDDATARLWKRDGNLLNVYRGHLGPIRSVAFAPNGRSIITGSDDNTIRLWETVIELNDFLNAGVVAELTEEQKEKYGIQK